MENTLYAWVTYWFESTRPYLNGVSLGLGRSIHCGSITKVEKENYNGEKIIIKIPNQSKFPFMRDANQIVGDGTGWNANRLHIITHINFDGHYPNGGEWKRIDITNKLPNFPTWSGTTIPKSSISDFMYEITFEEYENAPTYNLDYLNMPLDGDQDNHLNLGEEVIFFGNVKADAEAIIHRSYIDIDLPESEYNYSTNPTFNAERDDSVYITEIHIYDDEDNLIMTAKPNNPIKKNSTIGRTLRLSIDF
jgi:hypothetical protein